MTKRKGEALPRDLIEVSLRDAMASWEKAMARWAMFFYVCILLVLPAATLASFFVLWLSVGTRWWVSLFCGLAGWVVLTLVMLALFMWIIGTGARFMTAKFDQMFPTGDPNRGLARKVFVEMLQERR